MFIYLAIGRKLGQGGARICEIGMLRGDNENKKAISIRKSCHCSIGKRGGLAGVGVGERGHLCTIK